jgi:predicted small secreted protein
MTKRFGERIVSAALASFLLLGTVTLIAACNTTAGVGQDVSAAGRAVSNSAEKVKQGL